MRIRLHIVGFLPMLFAMGAVGQITGSGTSGTVPVFNGTSSVADSPLTVLSGNVLNVTNGAIKVGTGSSQYPAWGLNTFGSDGHLMMLFPSLGSGNYNYIVQGGDQAIIYSNGGANEGGGFAITPWTSSGPSSGLRLDGNGNVAVGTSSPFSTLHVSTSAAPPASSGNANSGVLISNGTSGADNSLNLGITTSYAWLQSAYANNSGVAEPLVFNQLGGNVGIGTINPQAKLEVNGALRFTGDGSVQTTAWTGVLCGGDYAEDVDGKKGKHYEPGDVLVLSSDDDGEVEKSAEPYSTLVAGIYATKPGVIGKRQTLSSTAEELPMAMVGIVPTKVTTENGPIRKGDLLVTSSKAGYAMKGTDRAQMLGAVIGKAMGSLNKDTGVIQVLVTLQ